MFTSQDIIKAVSRVTGISVQTILGDRRLIPIAYARHICFYLIRHYTKRSLPSIGSIFNRDHTSVLHGIRRMEREILNDPGYWLMMRDIFLAEAVAAKDARLAEQNKWLAVTSVDNSPAAAYVEATPGA